jgi:type I restriction enzyme, S subunit
MTSLVAAQVAETPPWCPSPPSSWGVVPLMTVGRESRVRNIGLHETNLLSLSYGRIISKDIEANEGLLPASFEGYQIVEPGYVVFRFTDLQNDTRSLRSGLVTERGIITSAYMAFSPRRIDSRYFSYLMRSYDTQKAFYGMGDGLRQTLNYQDVRRMPILVPRAGEQVAIADFLDRETAKIDALIEKQRALLSCLDDASVGIRDELLGRTVGLGDRLKWRFREIDDRVGPRWSHLPLMSVSIDWGVRRREDVTNDVPRSDDLSVYKVCRRGDIVINRMRAFQGALGVAAEDGMVSPDYAVLRTLRGIDAGWLAETMKTTSFVGEMTSRLRGIGTTEGGSVRTPRVGVADIGQIRLQVPDEEAQKDALGRLDAAREHTAAALSGVQRHIVLAQERRAALITAAVTGQMDIGKVA